jgi:6-pyruvoyltetrahydropterin/6-carboxytetrahydropterin synthase
MKYELTQEFYFEAAHTLKREIETDSSRRIHGHTYFAEVTVQGVPDATTGLLVDLGHLKAALHQVRDQLDHRFLDEVPGLGTPTLERLCEFIAQALHGRFPNLSRVTVARRASGDRCTLSL